MNKQTQRHVSSVEARLQILYTNIQSDGCKYQSVGYFGSMWLNSRVKTFGFDLTTAAILFNTYGRRHIYQNYLKLSPDTLSRAANLATFLSSEVQTTVSDVLLMAKALKLDRDIDESVGLLELWANHKLGYRLLIDDEPPIIDGVDSLVWNRVGDITKRQHECNLARDTEQFINVVAGDGVTAFAALQQMQFSITPFLVAIYVCNVASGEVELDLSKQTKYRIERICQAMRGQSPDMSYGATVVLNQLQYFVYQLASIRKVEFEEALLMTECYLLRQHKIVPTIGTYLLNGVQQTPTWIKYP